MNVCILLSAVPKKPFRFRAKHCHSALRPSQKPEGLAGNPSNGRSVFNTIHAMRTVATRFSRSLRVNASTHLQRALAESG